MSDHLRHPNHAATHLAKLVFENPNIPDPIKGAAGIPLAAVGVASIFGIAIAAPVLLGLAGVGAVLGWLGNSDSNQ